MLIIYIFLTRGIKYEAEYPKYQYRKKPRMGFEPEGIVLNTMPLSTSLPRHTYSVNSLNAFFKTYARI